MFFSKHALALVNADARQLQIETFYSNNHPQK